MDRMRTVFFRVDISTLEKINAFFDAHAHEGVTFDSVIPSMLLGFIAGYTDAEQRARDEKRGEEL